MKRNCWEEGKSLCTGLGIQIIRTCEEGEWFESIGKKRPYEDE